MSISMVGLRIRNIVVKVNHFSNDLRAHTHTHTHDGRIAWLYVIDTMLSMAFGDGDLSNDSVGEHDARLSGLSPCPVSASNNCRSQEACRDPLLLFDLILADPWQ